MIGIRRSSIEWFLFVLAVASSVATAGDSCISADIAGWHASCSAAAESVEPTSAACYNNTCIVNFSIEAVATRRAAGESNATVLTSCLDDIPLSKVVAGCSEAVEGWRRSPVNSFCLLSPQSDTEACLAQLQCRSSLLELCSEKCLAQSLACFFRVSDGCNASVARDVCSSALWTDWALCSECGTNISSCSETTQSRCAVAASLALESSSSTDSLLASILLYIIAGIIGLALVLSACVVYCCCCGSSKPRRDVFSESDRRQRYGGDDSDSSGAGPRRAPRDDRDLDNLTPPPIRRWQRSPQGRGLRTEMLVDVSAGTSESPSQEALADTPEQLSARGPPNRPFSFGELLAQQNQRMEREAAELREREDGAPQNSRGWVAPEGYDDEGDDVAHEHHAKNYRHQHFGHQHHHRPGDDSDYEGQSATPQHGEGCTAVMQYDGGDSPVDDLQRDSQEKDAGDLEYEHRHIRPVEWHGERWRHTSQDHFVSPGKPSPRKVNSYALYSDDDLAAPMPLSAFDYDDVHETINVGSRTAQNGSFRTAAGSQQTRQTTTQPAGSMSLGDLELQLTERSGSSAATDLARQPSDASDSQGPGQVEGWARDRVRRRAASVSRQGSAASSRPEAACPVPDPNQRLELAHMVKTATWTRGRLLGRGASGAVYQAVFANGTVLACKEVDVKLSPQEDIDKMLKFFAQFVELQHPNVIQCFAVTYDAANSCIRQWMDVLRGGSLHRLARKASGVESRAATPVSRRSTAGDSKDNVLGSSGIWAAAADAGGLSESVVAEYARQILLGLDALHKMGIVHRDIKGSNVLLTDDRRCARIIDFDSATSTKSSDSDCDNSRPPSVVGTPLWMAPEILTMQSPCTAAADVYSFGITVAELIGGGNPPWPEFENTWSAMLHLASTNARPQIPPDASPELQDLLRLCWSTEPTRRPSVAALLQHPWLECRCGSPALACRPRSEGQASGANSEVQSVASSSGWLSTRE